MKSEEKTNLPANLAEDYGDYAGAGFENMSRDEYRIPFVRILQTNSPQVRPTEAGGLGLTAGHVLNVSTGESWSGKVGFDLFPFHREHNFVEYVPRDAGGGFKGIYPPDDPIVFELQKKHGKFGKLPTGTGTELVETFYLYVMMLDPNDPTNVVRVVVSFASTQIKKYQNFIVRSNNITYPNKNGVRVRPPMWAHRWHLGTQFESNAKGEFFGWDLRLASEPPITARISMNDPIFALGVESYDLMRAGVMKAEEPPAQDEAADEDIPF